MKKKMTMKIIFSKILQVVQLKKWSKIKFFFKIYLSIQEYEKKKNDDF